jgi:predicted kinase
MQTLPLDCHMLVSLSGLPGTGKTTLARAVARAFAAVYLRIDSIEQAIREVGHEVESEGYAIAYAIAEDNLRLGRIVVTDCVNPWPLTRGQWRAVAARADVPALDVEVVCADSREHRRRVEARVADIAGLRLPTWQDVTTRDDQAWDRQRVVIDTARMDVEESVRTIVSEVDRAREPPEGGVSAPLPE